MRKKYKLTHYLQIYYCLTVFEKILTGEIIMENKASKLLEIAKFVNYAFNNKKETNYLMQRHKKY